MAHTAWYQLLYFPSSFHAEHGSSSSLQGPWAALPLKFPMWGSFISEELKGRSRLSSHLLIGGTMTWVIWAKSLGETKAGVFLQILLCESFLHVSPDGGRPLPKQCHPSGAEAGWKNQQLWWSPPSKSKVHRPQRLSTKIYKSSGWCEQEGLQNLFLVMWGQNCARIHMLRRGYTLWLLKCIRSQVQPAQRQ